MSDLDTDGYLSGQMEADYGARGRDVEAEWEAGCDEADQRHNERPARIKPPLREPRIGQRGYALMCNMIVSDVIGVHRYRIN